MAFVFFVLYLIVLYIRPAEWIDLFHGWQLADTTLIATAVFIIFRIGMRGGGFIKAPHTGQLLGILACGVLSHVVHTYIAGATSALKILGKIFITYFLVLHTVTSERTFKATLWILVFLTAILAYQGIFQYEHGYGWAGQTLSQGTRIRWISIFNDPNDLALAFVIVVPILLCYIMKPGFILGKILPAFLLYPLVYALYLTNSRGGFLALGVSVMFFFIKRSKYVVPGGIIGGTIAAVGYLFGPSRLGATMDESAMGRLDSWYYGFQLLKSNPVFGVGLNMFTEDYPLTAHNSFVLAAAELGLVGLFFFVGFLYVSFKSMSLVQKGAPRLAPYAYGLQAGLVGFAGAAFFLSRTYNEIPYLYCALSAALLNIARQYGVEFTFTQRDVRNIALASIGALVFVQLAMKTWL
jgi:O-antigen ligase